jgi:hypothetical protein
MFVNQGSGQYSKFEQILLQHINMIAPIIRIADHGGFKSIAYVLTILWPIYSSLIYMRCLHILLHN